MDHGAGTGGKEVGDGEDSSAPVEELLITCLQAADPDAAVAAAAARYPAHAAKLGRVLDRLRRLGLDADGPATTSPERLGPFTLLERLGEGGMGVVYRAWQDPPGREVALKVVRPDLLHFESSRARFRREVEACVRLSHPGIVAVHEVGVSDGVPWFSMAFVRGRNLAELLATLQGSDLATLSGDSLRAALQGQGTPGDETSGEDRLAGSYAECVVRIVLDVAGALAHAHARGVLHRDVKPSNVMLTATGRAVVLDFGLAVTEDSQRLTGSHAVLGSLPYMPPEQMRGEAATADGRVDVYSLGVVLYEMLTLRNPFLGPTAEATRRNVLEARPEDPLRIHPRIGRDLATVCTTAMAELPQQRYASMADLIRDLESVRQGRAIAVRPAGWVERARRFVRRNRLLVASTLAILAVLIAGSITSLLLFLEAEDQRIGAQHERDRAAWTAYVASAANAEEALLQHRVSRAIDALASTPAELRGWEFRHLLSRLDSSAGIVLQRPWPLVAMDARTDRLAAATAHTLFVVDRASGRVLRETGATGIEQVALVGDLVLWVDGERLHRCDVTTGRREASAAGGWWSFALHPDGESVVLASESGSVRRAELAPAKSGEDKRGSTWDVGTGASAISCAPDGRTFAVAVGPNVQVHDLKTGRRLREHSAHQGPILGLTFDPAGERLASASHDRTVRLWSAEPLLPIGFPLAHDAGVEPIAFDPRGRRLAAAAGEALALWNVRLGVRELAFHGHAAVVRAIRFESDALLTAGEDGTVRRFTLDDNDVLALRLQSSVRRGSISPDGRLVAAVSDGGVLRAWSLAERRILHDTVVDRDPRSVAVLFRPDGEALAQVSEFEARLVGTSDWVTRTTHRVEKSRAYRCAAFSPDSRILVLGSRDGTVWVHDSDRGQAGHELANLGGPIHGLAFLADGRRLAVAHSQGVSVLDASKGQVLAVLSRVEHSAIAVAPDGRIAAAGAGLSLWTADSGTCASVVSPGVRDLVFEPRRGGRLVTGGADGVLRVWHGADQVLELNSVGSSIRDLDFDATGRSLLSCDDRGEIRLWRAVAAEEADAVLSQAMAWRAIAGRRGPAGPRHYEAETLTVREVSGGTAAAREDVSASAGRRLVWSVVDARATLDLEVPADDEGSRQLTLDLAESLAGATRELLWNGQRIAGPGAQVDARAGSNTLQVRIEAPAAARTGERCVAIDWLRLR